MSFGCSSKELAKLLSTKKTQNRILNTQRVRLQKLITNVEAQTLFKN